MSRLAYLLACAVFCLGIVLPAHAAQSFPSRDQAWAACLAKANQLTADALPSNPNAPYQCQLDFEGPGGATGQYCVATKTGAELCSFSYAWTSGCPSGKQWNDTLKQCIGQEDCLARNAGITTEVTVKTFASACVAGCTLKAGGPTVGVDGMYTGVYQYSGNVCTPTTENPDKPRNEDQKEPPQECKQAANGQTFCLQPDGDHCYGASTGRQICWKPGETGQKDDQDVKQKRDAGNDAVPPDLNLPNGDTLTPKGEPDTKTTQVTDAQGNVRTIVTTTQNYGTTNGTNAGSGNSGESSSGDGSGKEGQEGEDPTATGGESCTAPPVMQGDAVAAMGALQAWRIRCGTTLADKNADGVPDYLNTADLDMSHGEAAVDGKSAWDETPADGAELDTGGFGLGDSCPAPPTFYGKTIDTSAMCDLAGIIAALVYAIALAHAAYIFGGNK